MKKRRIIWVCVVILLLILRSLPYEKWFIRFDTLEEAWNSTENKGKKIISKDTIDDITFISYIDGNNSIVNSYIAKDDKGWIPPINRYSNLKKCIDTDDFYTISYLYDYKKNIIMISYLSLKSQNKEIGTIRDNISTNFRHVRIDKDIAYLDKWYAVIDSLPKDYIITINDKGYKF